MNCPLPAALAPLLEMGPLSADRGVVAVDVERPVGDVTEEFPETAWLPGLSDATGEPRAAPDKRAAWDGLGLSQQRKALEVFGLQVVIKPARGGPGFKEDSVDVKWPGDD